VTETWLERFPDLAALPPAERERLQQRGVVAALPAGTVIFAPGKEAENFLLVLEGTVRVQQVSPSGREIVLYRVSGGEACIMTTSCLLSHEAYLAEGLAETDIRAVVIPRAAFEEMLGTSPGFRRIVFSGYSHRISDLMHVVEEVAFQRLDKRLAQRLLALAGSKTEIVATHQELAAELGTAREVVGRQLKELERRGWVTLSRGQVHLADRPHLEALAKTE